MDAVIEILLFSSQQYDRIMGPTKDATTNKVIFKHETLDTDGIVSPGEMLVNKQTMINKEMPAVSSMNPLEQKESGQQPVAYSGVNIRIKSFVVVETNF